MNLLIRELPKSLDVRIKMIKEEYNFKSKSEAIIYILSEYFETEGRSHFQIQLIENQKIIINILERNELILEDLLREIREEQEHE